MGDIGDGPAREVLLDYPSWTKATHCRDCKLAAARRGNRASARATPRRSEVIGRLRELWARALGFVRGREADHDLEAEIAAHLELAVEDHVRRGMDARDARRLAAMKFGSGISAREQA